MIRRTVLQVRVPVRVRPAEPAGLHPRGAARHGGPPAHRQEGGRALTRPRPRQYHLQLSIIVIVTSVKS